MAGDPPAPAGPSSDGWELEVHETGLICFSIPQPPTEIVPSLQIKVAFPRRGGTDCCHTETGAERSWKPVLYHSPSPGSSGTLGRPPNPSETPCPLFYQWPCCHQPALLRSFPGRMRSWSGPVIQRSGGAGGPDRTTHSLSALLPHRQAGSRPLASATRKYQTELTGRKKPEGYRLQAKTRLWFHVN